MRSPSGQLSRPRLTATEAPGRRSVRGPARVHRNAPRPTRSVRSPTVVKSILMTHRTAALCAGARRLRLLSVTDFPVSLRPRLAELTAANRPPGHGQGLARRTCGARPCPRVRRVHSVRVMRGRAESPERYRSGRLTRPAAGPATCCSYLIFLSAEMKLSTRASGVLQLLIHDTVARSRSCR
jgi:hypothetical protein